jgi:hypothetical protein
VLDPIRQPHAEFSPVDLGQDTHRRFDLDRSTPFLQCRRLRETAHAPRRFEQQAPEVELAHRFREAPLRGQRTQRQQGLVARTGMIRIDEGNQLVTPRVRHQ